MPQSSRLFPLLVVFLPTFATAQKLLTPRQVYDRCRSSVVSIEAKTAKGPVSGTGFFYEDGATVVTSLHVVLEASSIVVRDARGQTWQPMAVALDGSEDLIVLRLSRNTGHRPILHAPSESVHVGDPVYVIGDPLGLTATLSTGIVSALRQDQGVPYVQTTAAISPGSSGGPVLDSRGRAVGVVRFFFDRGQNLNLAVSTKEVRGLLAAHRFVSTGEYYVLVRQALERLGAKAVAKAPSAPTPKDESTTTSDGSTEQLQHRDETMLLKFFAHCFSQLLENLCRWDLEWSVNSDHNPESRIGFLADRQRLYAKAIDSSTVTQAFETFSHTSFSDEDKSEFLIRSASVARAAQDRADAEAACVRIESVGGVGLETAYKTLDDRRARLWEAMKNLFHVMERPAWTQRSALDLEVSPSAWSVVLLYNFRAIPEMTLTPPTVNYAYSNSKLQEGDWITGIRRRGAGAFVSVDSWASARKFLVSYFGDYTDLELRIVRHRTERVIGGK